MATSKVSFAAQALIAAVVVSAIIVLVNLIASRGLLRLDLTADQRFSVSEPTKRILADLRDSVKVTAYLSEELPTGLETLRRDLVDKFKEFAVHSGGNFEYEIVDPTGNEKLEEELAQRGINALRGQVLKRDKMEVMRFYSSLEISYLDKQPEIIPLIQRAEETEYELMSRIVRLTQSSRPIVAVYYGGIEDRDDPEKRAQLPQNMRSEYDPFINYLRELFDVREVRIGRNDRIPDDAQCLIVIRPKELDERQRYEINRTASRGVPVMLLVSRFDTPYDPRAAQMEQIDPGVDPLLAAWGVRMGESILSDRNCGTIEIVRSMGGFLQVRQPASLATMPMIMRGLNRDSIIARGVPDPGVLVPWPVALNVDRGKTDELGLKVTPLLQTSEETWRTSFSPMLSDEMLEPPEDKSAYIGSATVGILLEGPIPFAYEGQPIPAWPEPKEGEEDIPPLPGDETADATGIASLAPAPGGKVLLVASGDMLRYQHITSQMNQGTAVFFSNATEIFALGQDLINIRAKSYVSRPIDPEANTGAYKVLNVLLMPVLVVVFGIARALYRQAQKSAYLKQRA